MHRRSVVAILTAAILALASQGLAAQQWPSRAVTLVVPFAPGTTSDIVARSFAEHLRATIGQPVIIENKGGAGGNLGAAAVAKAAPDGYTVLFATTGPAANNKLMYKNMPFDPQRDFDPVVLIGKAPVILAARPDLPVRTVPDLVAYAKANPGRLVVASPGLGTLGHITGELLKQRAQLEFTQVQHRGSAAIIADLLGGHADVGIDSMAPYVSNIQGGKLRGLAIAGLTRWPGLPDVPTVAESGFPGFEASVWYALLVPRGTPPSVIDALNASANAYLGTDAAKAQFHTLGIEAAGGTPEALRRFIESEIERWGPVIRAANIQF